MMGLEIRTVRKDWIPPTIDRHGTHRENEYDHYQPNEPWKRWSPHYDEDWLSAWREWQIGRIVWFIKRPFIWIATMLGIAYLKSYGWPRWTNESYAEWGGDPPHWQSYRPRWSDKERTHLQLYETVSEGTPLSPPMPDVESLSRWCADRKKIWPGTEGMTYEDWMAFCESGGWAMSGVFTQEHGFEGGAQYIAREHREKTAERQA